MNDEFPCLFLCYSIIVSKADEYVIKRIDTDNFESD